MSRKSIAKRIKFTAGGKLLYRKAGQNHFNAKESRPKQRRQKEFAQFSKTMEKTVRAHFN